MHPSVLPDRAWDLVGRMEDSGLLQDWLLCGGTGLALHFGHRVSEDLDFFRPDDFGAEALVRAIADLGPVRILSRAENTIHTKVNNVKLSFIKSEGDFVFPPSGYRGLRIADPRDVAAMKLVAIGGRGSRRDFVDLYWYLQQVPGLGNVFQTLRLKDPEIDWNEYHLLRSLTWFEDAEQEPMPTMRKDIAWEDIKGYFEEVAVQGMGDLTSDGG